MLVLIPLTNMKDKPWLFLNVRLSIYNCIVSAAPNPRPPDLFLPDSIYNIYAICEACLHRFSFAWMFVQFIIKGRDLFFPFLPNFLFARPFRKHPTVSGIWCYTWRGHRCWLDSCTLCSRGWQDPRSKGLAEVRGSNWYVWYLWRYPQTGGRDQWANRMCRVLATVRETFFSSGA